MSSVQWYHDTGIFLTSSRSGSVLLWDTAAMAPVLESRPFRYEGSSAVSVSSAAASARTSSTSNTVDDNHQPNSTTTSSVACLQVSPFSLLAATGSPGSPKVKLVDLRSGASSHSLTPPHSNNGGGVTAVRWSPVHRHLLVGCGGGGVVALWDIRHTQRPLTVLNGDHRPAAR